MMRCEYLISDEVGTEHQGRENVSYSVNNSLSIHLSVYIPICVYMNELTCADNLNGKENLGTWKENVE